MYWQCPKALYACQIFNRTVGKERVRSLGVLPRLPHRAQISSEDRTMKILANRPVETEHRAENSYDTHFCSSTCFSEMSASQIELGEPLVGLAARLLSYSRIDQNVNRHLQVFNALLLSRI